MGNEPERTVRRADDRETDHDHENAPRTATEEALKEIEDQGHEEDSGTRRGRGGGSGDPISPSPGANKDAVRGDGSR
ncbi:hypothetical protein QFZ75_007300 [Streptomyces sp. V3I8]|uniref:hypothetical protein n=1 Tax=Streptomyces sp. V3I8 TaxID=3042279 RepID=UPI0027816973|nr:hypothetical protein [Streptomyces sp. V3I8]MDQ1040884.1 hypothetical protein [Streptomyces sp. V3I8]